MIESRFGHWLSVVYHLSPIYRQRVSSDFSPKQVSQSLNLSDLSVSIFELFSIAWLKSLINW